jgi:hypothetical protein
MDFNGINRANYILFSNHKDAIIKTGKDRRYAMVFCAQQREGDNLRSGLTPAYFKALYEWIDTAPVREDMHGDLGEPGWRNARRHTTG